MNSITYREFNAATKLEELGLAYDPVEDIVEFDYFSSLQAFPVRYSLDIGTLIETGRNYFFN